MRPQAHSACCPRWPRTVLSLAVSGSPNALLPDADSSVFPLQYPRIVSVPLGFPARLARLGSGPGRASLFRLFRFQVPHAHGRPRHASTRLCGRTTTALRALRRGPAGCATATAGRRDLDRSAVVLHDSIGVHRRLYLSFGAPGGRPGAAPRSIVPSRRRSGAGRIRCVRRSAPGGSRRCWRACAADEQRSWR